MLFLNKAAMANTRGIQAMLMISAEYQAEEKSDGGSGDETKDRAGPGEYLSVFIRDLVG